MRKRIFPLMIILPMIFANCSSDTVNPTNSQIQINPPNWIQGTWLLEESGLGEIGWRFASNDFIIIQAGNEISQRGQLEVFLESGQDVYASDESTETTYKITSKFLAGQTTVYSFTKVSDTEISWSTVPNSIYLKQ